MKRRRAPISKSSKVRRQRDPIPWRYCVLTVVCGLILTTGFFVAARQHFSSVGYAMENAKLRKKIALLNDERRKLTVERERASSPSQINKLAANIGFKQQPGRAVSAPVIQQVSAEDASPVYSYAGENKTGDAAVRQPVIKTVLSKPVAARHAKAAVSNPHKMSVDHIAALEEWDVLSRKD